MLHTRHPSPVPSWLAQCTPWHCSFHFNCPTTPAGWTSNAGFTSALLNHGAFIPDALGSYWTLGGSKNTENSIPQTKSIPLQAHSFSKISTRLLLLFANKSSLLVAKASLLPDSKILFLNKAFICMPWYTSESSGDYHAFSKRVPDLCTERFQPVLWWLQAVVLPSSTKRPFLPIATVQTEHERSFWTVPLKYSSEASISTYYKTAIPLWQPDLLFNHI